MGRQHLAALEASRSIDLLGIVDPAGVPDGQVEWKLDSALTDPRVSGFVVAAPTNQHAKLVGAALAHGKHVLCEKPLTLDPALDRALGQNAAARGLILQVGFWRRFAAPYRRIRSLIQSAVIGAPFFIRLSQWDAQPPPMSFCDSNISGGIEVDCGVHEFDLARWILEFRPARTRAIAIPDADYGDDTLVAAALMEDGDGVPLFIDLARTAGGTDTIRSEFLGREGSLVCEIGTSGRLEVRSPAGTRIELFDGDVIAEALARQLDAFSKAIGRAKADPDAAGAEAAAAALADARSMRQARIG